jgi:integrase
MFRHGYKFLWEGKRNQQESYLITEELIRRLGAETPVANISAAAIQDLILELRLINSGARINRKMSALRMLLKHCYARGAITQVPVFPKPQPESEGRERFLTKDETEAVINSLSSVHHQDFARFLLHTGARIGEALALRWQDVGDDRVTFRWDTTKAKRTRTVGLNEAAKNAVHHGRAAGWSMPWEGIEYRTFLRDWDQAKHKAGLGDDPEVVPHILRHTHASWLVQRGVPIQVVSKLLGHSSITITMRYAKLAPDNLLNVTGVLV